MLFWLVWAVSAVFLSLENKDGLTNKSTKAVLTKGLINQFTQ